MNESLQKTALTLSHSMTSYLRRTTKSDSKALCIVCDLSQKKRHTKLLARELKFAWLK